MSITVKDCLSLPSLSLGHVIAGKSGLGGIVNAISVVEFDFTDDTLYTPNELCITAFYNIRDNVEDQCKAIEALKKSGDVGLIVFYSDAILNGVDQSIIDAADRLSFPLILLPGQDMGLKYSDVIKDVMEAIFMNSRSTNSYVNNTMEMISQMAGEHRNISNVLGFASTHSRAGFFLFDGKLSIIAHSFWPAANELDISVLKEELMREGEKNSYFMSSFGHCYRQNFETKNEASLVLVAISQNQKLTWQAISDTVEIIQLFSSIWNYNLKTSAVEALVTACLEGELSRASQICITNNINIAEYNGMLLIDASNESLLAKLRQTAASYNINVIADSFGGQTVVFIPAGTVGSTKGSLLFEQLNIMCFETISEGFTLINNVDILNESRDIFYDYTMSIKQAKKIYSMCRSISQEQLYFAVNCTNLVKTMGKDYFYYFNLLKPVYEEADAELANTLETYFFDADSQVKKTSELLYIHRNTVLYRLNKVSEMLGSDISKMPLAYDVYISAALHRLMR